ncbi:hypothetical protein EST38_g9085 [Candolleomyces aberdarensis]|uniref:Alpha/beta hydrolase fold-3 domain-containing protein n=1 Tax=Candolleomyces aberdarensis TaxID=2316362 RepID=A0A4Q2DBN2_9AGAR|nr:hypothetical protein EST38_g9085 [Candolleomyces aberdarensis]
MSSFPFRQQPLKGLYIVYQLVSTLFIRLPFWIITSLPSSTRARPTWTLKRALLLKFVRHFTNLTFETGVAPVANYLAIKSGKGVNGVWIDPATELITGDLEKWAEIAKVKPTRLPGYWFHQKGSNITVGSSPQPGEKVVLNLHGGAYVRMSAHPSDPTANIVRGILKHTPSIRRVFSVEYRLSSGKPFTVAHPFPTSLIDVLAGYNYLVNVVGYSPSDIIICGDSAGGNLAHALTRYLVENQHSTSPKLPAPPGALILLSPWSDLSKSHDGIGSAISCVKSDYLSADHRVEYAKDAFTGPHGRVIADSNPYISPACILPGFEISFKGFPRTFINSGGGEVLIDQIRLLRDRMVADLGEGDGVKPGEGKVRYYEAADACHDYLVLSPHEPERTETLKVIAQWVQA